MFVTLLRKSQHAQAMKRRRYLPIFQFNKAFGMAQEVKAYLLNSKSVVTRSVQVVIQRKKQAELRKRLSSERQELHKINRESRATKKLERIERKKRKKTAQQEIFQLERELGATKERAGGIPDGGQPAPQAADGSETGALPDFIIIGGKKCGTTFLYNLLTQHPHVEPAAKKELHYFDTLFGEGIEWYRRCFPPPRWKDGRRTFTGEGTPYLHRSSAVPERMAEMLPQARLIALLRNPADRAYSDYQQKVRKGRETRTFEEAIEVEKTQPLGGKKTSEHEARAGLNEARFGGYLSKGIYADQLLRWSRFFDEEQMLVLKSEDFFERTPESLKVILDFLGLPDWEPGTWETPKKLNKGEYEQEMDPATRRRLEDYFEPHNRRLYEYLGTDFGW